MKKRVSLLDTAYAVKSGALKQSEVREGISKAVKRITQEMSQDELAGYVKDRKPSQQPWGRSVRHRAVRGE